ncbi:MAG: DUF1295 domain-containing protein [Planctomycetaceae bacterium]
MTSGLLATSLLAGTVVFTIAWVISLVRHRVDIIDSFWGLGFIAAVAVVRNPVWLDSSVFNFPAGVRTAADLLFVMLIVWALRLSIQLFWRWTLESREDHRYTAMRNRNPPRWKYTCLITVFWLQTSIMWVVSLPIQAAMLAGQHPADEAAASAPLSLAGHLLLVSGLLLSAGGVIFEGLADWQLFHFRRNPANVGRVLDTGLWRFSRHPNYFGEFTVWWGFFLLTQACGVSILAITSPILMSLFLLRISGVTLMEKDISQRRPEYQHYAAVTNTFFPGPRKKMDQAGDVGQSP